jgi:hypothetical protein
MTEEQNQKALKAYERISNTRAKEFASFWSRLCAAYPRQELPEATVVIYAERLRRFTPEHLRRAADIIIDNCEYFPTVAEIITTIQRLPKPKPQILLEKPMMPEEQTKVQNLIGNLANHFNSKRNQ